MDKITIEEYTHPITGEVSEYVIIDLGNDEFCSMPKSVYDAQQAAQATLASESAKKLAES